MAQPSAYSPLPSSEKATLAPPVYVEAALGDEAAVAQAALMAKHHRRNKVRPPVLHCFVVIFRARAPIRRRAHARTHALTRALADSTHPVCARVRDQQMRLLAVMMLLFFVSWTCMQHATMIMRLAGMLHDQQEQLGSCNVFKSGAGGRVSARACAQPGS